ncbi:MAG: hypothetical protein GY750_18485 [Lentisphaerae bacterium]|nr:hypothetical protein [Lentisphaerota bacterium]MCP4103386.1 hypothetical protein [Lentisphaerota bacterium]
MLRIVDFDYIFREYQNAFLTKDEVGEAIAKWGEVLMAYWGTIGRKILLFGHGGWQKEYLNTVVPTNSTISFYCPHITFALTEMFLENGILDGGSPKTYETYRSGKTLPNYALSQVNHQFVNMILGKVCAFQHRCPTSVIFVRVPVKLSDIFKGLQVYGYGNKAFEFHWLACRAVKFNNTSMEAILNGSDDARSDQASQLGVNVNTSWTEYDKYEYSQNRRIFDSDFHRL